MADLFGVAGRELLDSLRLPEPWQANLVESLALIDDLTARADALELELRNLGAQHPSMRLLMTVPGVGWVLAYTIGSEIGDIGRFASPKKLAGYTGLCPLVRQSGAKDRRGPLAKNGPKYLRWALIEAAPMPLATPTIGSAMSGRRRDSDASAARRSPGSISPASWPRQSGTS
jgi:transposase